MAQKKTPDEVMKKIEAMTDEELKDAIVRTCIRQARAEADLGHYKETYGEVIKEEKEQRSTYLAALEIRAETLRRQIAAEGVLADADSEEEKSRAVDIIRLVQQGASA